MPKVAESKIETIPSWVEGEIENWVRSQKSGELPGPPVINPKPTFCAWPRGEGDFGKDAPSLLPFIWERAMRVQAIFESLPLVERRMVAQEYLVSTRYDPRPVTHTDQGICFALNVPMIYLKLALNSFRRQVWKEFDE